MLNFQENLLRDELDQLPAQSRVAFAASCAQRLVGAYHRFAAETRQPNGARLDRAVDYVWAHILGAQEKETTEILLGAVMALIPQGDAPGWTPLTAYAEDAVSSVAYCLRCLLTSDSQEAAWAARRVYEALDAFVISRDNITPGAPGAEESILSDPVIQAELKRQIRDVADLKAVGRSLSAGFLKSLRERSGAESYTF
jgi:uncharacterized protein YjaG (DUF416 family)